MHSNLEFPNTISSLLPWDSNIVTHMLRNFYNQIEKQVTKDINIIHNFLFPVIFVQEIRNELYEEAISWLSLGSWELTFGFFFAHKLSHFQTPTNTRQICFDLAAVVTQTIYWFQCRYFLAPTSLELCHIRWYYLHSSNEYHDQEFCCFEIYQFFLLNIRIQICVECKVAILRRELPVCAAETSLCRSISDKHKSQTGKDSKRQKYHSAQKMQTAKRQTQFPVSKFSSSHF